MIDLNNTWCEATGENREALKKLNIKLVGIGDYRKYLYIDTNGGYLGSTDTIKKEWKQIHLVNGEFQYVETKPKNNFKDYGFEADFEGEILSDIEDYYIGYYIETYPCVKEKQKIPTFWNKNTGNCYKGAGISNSKYSLKPIKKEWYENPDNFPVVMIDIETKKPHVAYAYKDGRFQTENFTVKFNKYRPATKEEVLSLLVKE